MNGSVTAPDTFTYTTVISGVVRAEVRVCERIQTIGEELPIDTSSSELDIVK